MRSVSSMVHHCKVAGCPTVFNLRGHCKPEGLKLHRFPRDDKRQNEWITNVQTVNGPTWFPSSTDNARICSLHFTVDSYELGRQDGLIKLKWNAVPTIFPGTTAPLRTDHIYSAHEDTLRQRERKSKRKVLENIVNSQVADHGYASPYIPPLSDIESEQSLETTNNSSTVDNNCSLPKSDISNYVAISSKPEEEVTEITPNDGAWSIGSFLLPDGSQAQLLTKTDEEISPSRRKCKNTFTDSEIDKIQIRQLSEENRKLQSELAKMKAFSEKLLRQNERLRQSNRVTALAYRKLKKRVDRLGGNEDERLNDDPLKAFAMDAAREQQWSQDTAEEAFGNSTVMYKALSQKLPYSSFRNLQEEGNKQKYIFVNGELGVLTDGIPLQE